MCVNIPVDALAHLTPEPLLSRILVVASSISAASPLIQETAHGTLYLVIARRRLVLLVALLFPVITIRGKRPHTRVTNKCP
jgi:hypothetical protein